jgi:hypothetical protein
MSNTNFNSINNLFSSFNINPNPNTTMLYSNEITTPIFVPYPQMVMTPSGLNQTYIPSPTPTPNFYHGHTYIPITTTPIPTPLPYVIHHSMGGNGTHPVGWTQAWGATGTHPPATYLPGSSFGNSGHTGQWENNKKNMLFTNKFAFEEKDFSIKIHYLDDAKNGILNRLYELKCNDLTIKTILKINEDTFEAMNNKKFDKIVEILEKLSKMNLYYSNICKSILVKDIFINKKLTSKFIIEI